MREHKDDKDEEKAETLADQILSDKEEDWFGS